MFLKTAYPIITDNPTNMSALLACDVSTFLAYGGPVLNNGTKSKPKDPSG